MIIDDTPNIRLLLRHTLPLHGFEIAAEASNAAEGVELANSEQPDVIVLDMHMPDMDGLDAIPLIKEKAPKSKILVYTGVDDPAVKKDALARGVAAFLDKWSPPAEVASEMNRILTLNGPAGESQNT